jgi:integrase
MHLPSQVEFPIFKRDGVSVSVQKTWMLTSNIIMALKESVEGGAMGLFKRKNSECWQMCFFLEGRKVRMSTGTTNKRLAKQVYEKTKAKVVTGNFPLNPESRASMPFSEFVDDFLNKHCRVEKASYKRDEVIGNALKKHFGRIPIGRIKTYEIIAWRERRAAHITRMGTPITKASLNRELAFLKTMFNLAVEWGWLKENPTARVKKLKGETKRLRILSRDEIVRLIDSARESLKPILMLAVATGMRKSEILNLKWKDINFTNGFIRVTLSKNSEARNVPFDSHIKEMLFGLRKGRRQSEYVFCRKNGDRILCVKEAFKAACDRAGISDFRFHDLRHTAASLLAAGGCDIITLQHVLGHKTLAMTQRYTHLVPGQHEKTREIMQALWGTSSGSASDTKVTQSGDRQNLSSVSH